MELGRKSYPDYEVLSFAASTLRWHFGLGGRYPYSFQKRDLGTQLAYLQPIGGYREIHKIIGLPPRTSFAYITENNINIANFTGTIRADGSTY